MNRTVTLYASRMKPCLLYGVAGRELKLLLVNRDPIAHVVSALGNSVLIDAYGSAVLRLHPALPGSLSILVDGRKQGVLVVLPNNSKS